MRQGTGHPRTPLGESISQKIGSRPSRKHTRQPNKYLSKDWSLVDTKIVANLPGKRILSIVVSSGLRTELTQCLTLTLCGCHSDSAGTQALKPRIRPSLPKWSRFAGHSQR
eukprot:4739837-Amphidinium_carterae.1